MTLYFFMKLQESRTLCLSSFSGFSAFLGCNTSFF